MYSIASLGSNIIGISYNCVMKKIIICAILLIPVLCQASTMVMTTDKRYRYIRSNGIPEHATGRFPNANNPNQIRPQTHRFRMPLHPKPAQRITPLRRMRFGVALNGVPFDPGTAEAWRDDPRSGWNYEAISDYLDLGLDDNNAHVQPSGSYQYHAIPTGLIRNRDNTQLVGYAADGFPIYYIKGLQSSYRLKSGVRPVNSPGGAYDGRFTQDYVYVPGLGDLDECNGQQGKTAEYPDGTYYYVLTTMFPYIPRCFKGKPDDSFKHRGRRERILERGRDPDARRQPEHRPPWDRGGDRRLPPDRGADRY